MGRPVMEYIIELMKNAGITDIAVTLMYMPHIITEHFGDGSKFGVRIKYYIEDTPLGTAGSVKNAQEFFDDTFIIVSGDSLTDIDIKKRQNSTKKGLRGHNSIKKALIILSNMELL